MRTYELITFIVITTLSLNAWIKVLFGNHLVGKSFSQAVFRTAVGISVEASDRHAATSGQVSILFWPVEPIEPNHHTVSPSRCERRQLEFDRLELRRQVAE